MKVKLGQKVRDIITGFEGTATGRTEYLTGCVQISIVPPVDKDGKVQEGHWFDEDRLQIIEAKPVKLNIKNDGGPHPEAPRVR